MASRKVRYKKLNAKTPLPVFREEEVDAGEYEILTGDAEIATGVDAGEQSVRFLPHPEPAGHVILTWRYRNTICRQH
jgi:hypothetical protein